MAALGRSSGEVGARSASVAPAGDLFWLLLWSSLKSQVSSFKSFRGKIIFAYEPIWAIGTGEHAENDDINEVVDYLRSEFDQEIEILYGGSVNVENCDDLHEKTDINGLLVGGASLNPKEFAKIAAL